jgi:hypothetical protein
MYTPTSLAQLLAQIAQDANRQLARVPAHSYPSGYHAGYADACRYARRLVIEQLLRLNPETMEPLNR